MVSIARRKAFYIGCLLAFCLVIVANLYSYEKMYDPMCIDCLVGFGWPFRWYETGGFFGMTRILWPSLIGDILLAISLSVAAGLLSRWYFSSRKRKLKLSSHKSRNQINSSS